MALTNCTTIAGADGRELKKHGSAFFPVAAYHDDLRREAVPWHWHEEPEAAVITDGEARLLVETEVYQIKKGDGYFINTGVLHGVEALTDSGCCMHSIVFHPRLVGGSAESVFWQNYIRPLLLNHCFTCGILDGSVLWHRKACDSIETAWQAMAKEPQGYEFQVRGSLSQLILLLHMHQPEPKREPSQRELRDAQRIRTMLQYIQEHYMEEVTTASLAASAMISESECLRCFHKTIGLPPMQYLKQFRIQKAAELLISTEKKIGDIGAECGFLDTSYFTKVFRELRGCTPGEYRRRERRYVK